MNIHLVLTRVTLILVCAAYLRDGAGWPILAVAVLQALGLLLDAARCAIDRQAVR